MKEEKVYSVYIHVCLINLKMYIGITKQKPEQRWRNGKGYRNNVLFWRAIQKYGWNNFKHVVLFNYLTKEEAEEIEIELIAFHKSNKKEFGYNITNGGNTTKGYRHSLESRMKMSKSSMGQIAWNKGLYKEKNPLYGKKRPQSVIHKMKKHNKFKKTVICLETLNIYESIADASRKMNIPRESIRDNCNHRRKSCYKLHFMFLNEYKLSEEYKCINVE